MSHHLLGTSLVRGVAEPTETDQIQARLQKVINQVTLLDETCDSHYDVTESLKCIIISSGVIVQVPFPVDGHI